MSDILVTLYAQEIARLTHRALTAEARVAELEKKLEGDSGVRSDSVA